MAALLLAVPCAEPAPQHVITVGPAACRTPLRQRFGAGECPRFVAQHLEIMLEVEHVLAPLMATLVPRNLFATPILWDFSTFLRLKIGPNLMNPLISADALLRPVWP